MIRLACIATTCALILAAMPRTGLALDTGGGVASRGPAAHVTTSQNRAPDYKTANPGPAYSVTAGRGVSVTPRQGTNPTNTGAYSASAQVMDITAGKRQSTQNVVPGRNDPMPILAGKRRRDYYGNLGL